MTIDDIWKLFQETNRMFQESKREWEQSKQKSEREWERSKQEWDRRFQESKEKSDRELEETWRVVKDVSRQIGQLGSRWGEFVEEMVAPACETLFLDRGIPVHRVHQRVKAKYPGNRHMEIDLLVVNTDVVVLVEVKSELRVEDVREHLNRLAEFKGFFPEYADRRVMGAVAGMVVEEHVEGYAMNEGLFVIVQSGDAVKLANDKEFNPKTW
ncbi:MAG: DUF3782 domain-containing protein [Magnetococcales bacterium]|nr:DUF3782 domain-containing protein [Magnetococcales bacterium]